MLSGDRKLHRDFVNEATLSRLLCSVMSSFSFAFYLSKEVLPWYACSLEAPKGSLALESTIKSFCLSFYLWLVLIFYCY